MNRKQTAVSNAGPIIHLNEIGSLNAFGIFSQVLIPPEVETETKLIAKSATNIRVTEINAAAKNLSKVLMAENAIDLGEAQAISLAASKGIKLFLTDDLAARDTAKNQGMEPHGTLGILLRAFREGLITKSDALSRIAALHENSSLFLTKDLVEWIKKEIEQSTRRK